jgi:CHAT domain-containing protein
MLSIITRETSRALLFATVLALTIFAQKPQKDDVLELLPGQTFRRELRRTEIHKYQVSLQKDEFFQVRVDELGINVILKLLDAKGDVLTTVNSPTGSKGPETLTYVAVESGRFILEISDIKSNVNKGSYAIKREAARPATAKDRRRVEVEHVFREGMEAQNVAGQMDTALKKFSEAQAGWIELADSYMEGLARKQIEESKARDAFTRARALYDQGTIFSFKIALNKFQEAARLYQEKGNSYFAVASLLGAALVSYDLGDFNSAVEIYKEALPLSRAAADRFLEADILDCLGKVQYVMGENSAALDSLNQALLIFKTVGQQYRSLGTLFYIGATQQSLGQREKALEIFYQILPKLKASGDKDGQATTMNSLGTIYFDSGEYQKSLFYHDQSLRLRRESGDKCLEASSLTNMGVVYNVMGEKSKALDILVRQAMPLYKPGVKCSGLPATLNNIGKVYYELGENQKALEYCKQALPLFKAGMDKRGQAAALVNIGSAYNASGKYQEALESYNASLVAYREVGDRKREATALTNIGVVHSALGDNEKALLFFNQALPLERALGDKDGEAITLNNIGKVYLTSGDKAKALESINQALLLFRAVGDRRGESTLLGNAMFVWESLNNRRLAIFYGKLSVNKLQQLRGAVKGLDNETQKTFLSTVQHTYQKLAELLIEENRLEQAIQVLSLYQDQQFFDFNRDTNASLRETALSPRERQLAKRYEAAASKVEQAGSRIEALKPEIGNPQQGDHQPAKLQELEAKLKTASDSLLAVLKNAEKEFNQPPGKNDGVPATEEVADMRKALEKLGAATKQKTATLYTLIGSDKLHVILVTVDGEVKAFESHVKATDLNKKILEFYALLQSPTYDPRFLGKELYDIIFKPVEPELKKSGAQILMWQLDGSLRYVPVAALWDGEHYLVERYQNVAFTRADTKRILQKVSKRWSGTGFGNSQEYNVDLLRDEQKLIHFSALSGVTEELAAIFKPKAESRTGILTGEVFSDKSFTRTAFLKAAQARRPIVHIASHFRFYPGDSSLSFLLLGDGSVLTLNEMKNHQDLFKGVELLTLSACNTAATRSNAEGREIDGFAELAQRLGASAVIATLWQVSDASTPWLMSEFYLTREASKGITKSEALRKAQVALLNGTADTRLFAHIRKGGENPNLKTVVVPDASKQPRDLNRSEIVSVSEKDAPLFKHDATRPYAHPYYWSPFVLFGNWR